jgi:hypothetical protein
MFWNSFPKEKNSMRAGTMLGQDAITDLVNDYAQGTVPGATDLSMNLTAQSSAPGPKPTPTPSFPWGWVLAGVGVVIVIGLATAKRV